jgi:fructose-bisphosphate aldolase, class II
MPLVTTHQLYQRALRENFAVAAFNINNDEVLRAVMAGAQEECSPVILMFEPVERMYFQPRHLRHIMRAVIEESSIDVVLHLDHGDGWEVCKACIDEGFTSVMIDGSALPLEMNVALTARVARYAHERGVVVEAELGHLRPPGLDGSQEGAGDWLTDPEEAVGFVRQSGCDSLAVAIGTSHGMYKFQGAPRLDFARLAAIQERLPGFPLVLHGASSVPQELVLRCEQYGAIVKGACGVPEDMVAASARCNICKVNFDTDLRLAMTAGVRRHLAAYPSNIDPQQFLGCGRAEVQDIVQHKIRLLGSAGRMRTAGMPEKEPRR